MSAGADSAIAAALGTAGDTEAVAGSGCAAVEADEAEEAEGSDMASTNRLKDGSEEDNQMRVNMAQHTYPSPASIALAK